MLQQYQKENSQNLGYDDSLVARIETYPCQVLEKKLVTETYTEKEVVSREASTSQSYQRNFVLKLSKTFLQDFENDVIEIDAGKDDNQVNIEFQGPTRYRTQTEVKAGVTFILVEGLGRAKMDLPSTVYKSSQLLSSGADSVFVVKIDPRFLPQASHPPAVDF